MLRTLALGGCMGALTPKGLRSLTPLIRLTTLVLVHVPGMPLPNDSRLARLSSRSLGPPMDDTNLLEVNLVRFLDQHPVLQDWELFYGYWCSNRVITVRRSVGNVLVEYRVVQRKSLMHTLLETDP